MNLIVFLLNTKTVFTKRRKWNWCLLLKTLHKKYRGNNKNKGVQFYRLLVSKSCCLNGDDQNGTTDPYFGI